MTRRTVAFSDGVATAPFVDAHAHIGTGISKYGVERPDRPLRLLSQGDAGPNNIKRIRSTAPPGTRYALSLAANGEESDAPCYESSNLDPEGVTRAVHESGSDIWGISVNLDPGALGTTQADPVFSASLRVAIELGLPLVLGTGSISQGDVTGHIDALRPGDVITYLFRGGDSDLFKRQDTIDALGRARRRGVHLDASHGAYSFDFAVARRAIALGLAPDTLSSDQSTMCGEVPFSLQHAAVGKAMAAGMSVEDALAACTARPGSLLNVAASLPVPGQSADFDVVSWNNARPDEASPTLRLVATVRGGEVKRFASSQGV
jgi:dihydroorotase